MASGQEPPANPPSYPQDGSYADFLQWHLDVWGTRPTGSRTESSEPWKPQEFTALVIPYSDENSARISLRGWLGHAHRPDRTNAKAIENALFGGNANFHAWKIDLRLAWERSRGKGNNKRTVKVPLELDQSTAVSAGNVAIELSRNVAADLTELLAIARRGGVFEQAANRGIPEVMVRTIVERLGGEGVARDDLIDWLEGWIEAAHRELSRHCNEAIAFELARTEAARRFRTGQTEGISAPLMELFEQEKAESRQRRILLLEEAIRFDLMSLDMAGAASKERLIASIRRRIEEDEIGDTVEPHDVGWFLLSRAGEYRDTGNQQGDNIALLMGVRIARVALEEWPRSHFPFDWAIAQQNLGAALAALGERESGTARLHEAVTAFRQALEEWSSARDQFEWVEFEWANTTVEMAKTLAELAQRTKDVTLLGPVRDDLSHVSLSLAGDGNGDRAAEAMRVQGMVSNVTRLLHAAR